MLHLLFLLLKIIGIILLVVLGLFLLLLALILFVPVRYHVNGEKYEKILGQADVTWLFHLIHAHVEFKDKKLSYFVRVAWKRILKSDSEEDSKEEFIEEPNIKEPAKEEFNKKELNKEQLKKEQPKEEKTEISDFDYFQEEKRNAQPVKEDKVLKESEFTKEKEPAAKPKITLKERIGRIKKKTEDFFTDAAKRKEKIEKQIDKLKKKVSIYYRFLTNEVTEKTLRHIKKEIIFLIRHFLPRKVVGDIYLGFDDPATTGQVIGYIAALNAVLHQPLLIRFNFEEKVLEGSLNIKGHIRAVHVLKSGISLILDRNLWKTIKRLKRLRKK